MEIGKITSAVVSPIKRLASLEGSSAATRVSLEAPQDIVEFSSKKAAKKGIFARITGFIDSIKEAATKKAAEAAEATRTRKALDSDLGQLLKSKSYQRDWGTSSYGGVSTERLYSDKSIVAICEMNESNPKKAMHLMEILREDLPKITFAQAAKIQETSPENFAILSKVGKINEAQFTALASAKNIDPNIADGLSISSIKALDASAGKSQESLEAVNKIMQDKTLRGVLSKDVPAKDISRYVENMTKDPELTTRFTQKFSYEMQRGSNPEKSLEQVNTLIDTYKAAPGRMGAYIDGYGIKEPSTLMDLYAQDKQRTIMHLLEERSHGGFGMPNAAEYVRFRTNENNAAILENILSAKRQSYVADEVESVMSFVKAAKEKGIDTESIMSRMAEDKRKPQTSKEFRRLFNIYASYPGEKISTEFIDFYTKNQELAPHVDLMAAFKG